MGDNIFITKIKDIIKKCDNDTKIILWGAGSMGKYVHFMLQAYGRDIAYYIDSSEELQKVSCNGKEVKSPYDIMYEEQSKICVIKCMNETPEVGELGDRLQLKKDINLLDLSGIYNYRHYTKLDPFLGVSREDDVLSFKLFSDVEINHSDTIEFLRGGGWRKKNRIRILTLGGSTTDYSTSYLKSWPEYIHEILQKEGIKHLIINGGICGYNTAQELLKLIRDGLYWDPHIVISYSGVNNAAWLHNSSKHPFVTDYFVHVMKQLTKDNTILYRGTGSLKTIDYGMETSESEAAFWLRCMRLMHGICAEYRILFYGFLQPSALYGNYHLSDIERRFIAFKRTEEQLKVWNNFFEEAGRYCKNYNYLYDLTSIFDGMSGIFYDDSHTDEHGNQIIAQKIYQIIQPSLAMLLKNKI